MGMNQRDGMRIMENLIIPIESPSPLDFTSLYPMMFNQLFTSNEDYKTEKQNKLKKEHLTNPIKPINNKKNNIIIQQKIIK